MFPLLLDLDATATALIRDIIPHSAFFDTFFSFLSLIGGALFIWVIILALLIMYEETHLIVKQRKRFILQFALATGGTLLLVHFVIKNIFARARPDVLFYSLGAICPTDFSFPSGHAATAFAAATVLAVYDKKRRAWYFILATLIALSRIYLGCHFVGDVIVGGLLGFFIAKLTLRVLKWYL